MLLRPRGERFHLFNESAPRETLARRPQPHFQPCAYGVSPALQSTASALPDMVLALAYPVMALHKAGCALADTGSRLGASGRASRGGLASTPSCSSSSASRRARPCRIVRRNSLLRLGRHSVASARQNRTPRPAEGCLPHRPRRTGSVEVPEDVEDDVDSVQGRGGREILHEDQVIRRGLHRER